MTHMHNSRETALLEAQNLTCQRGERQVFADLTFGVGAGEALILRGRNGSGKSSLLRLIAGLLVPADGTLSWDGVPIDDDPASHRARLAYVGHLDPIKPALSVAENLTAMAGLGGDRADVEAGLRQFGLLPQRDLPARFLSAGQRRRLNLARLAAGHRPLWLLDEPTVALDTNAIDRLFEALSVHLAGGGVALIATHDAIDIDRARTMVMPG